MPNRIFVINDRCTGCTACSKVCPVTCIDMVPRPAEDKAKGVKHNGRWVVFYHPGDMNDAWKTGHTGMQPEIAKHAMEMGINIV